MTILSVSNGGNKVKRFLERILAIGLTLAAGCAPDRDQGLEWKLNNNFAASRVETEKLHAFAADITRSSGGRLTVTVHDGGSLGLEDADIFRWLPTGAVDIGIVNPTYLGRDAPELNAIYIQGSVRSREEHRRALPVLEPILGEVVRSFGVVPLGYLPFPVMDMSVFCSDSPVRDLASLRTKKVRVWSKDLVETFGRLGVAAQIIPQNEMYIALQTGVVDCVVFSALYAHTVSLDEVTRYASYLFPVAPVPYVIAVSEKSWTCLPPDLKQVVLDATERMYRQCIDWALEPVGEKAARKRMADGGVQWLEAFPDTDRRAFLDAARITWRELARRAGGKTPQYRDAILEALGR